MKFIVERRLDQFIEIDAPSEREALRLAYETMDSLWHTEDVEYDVQRKEKS